MQQLTYEHNFYRRHFPVDGTDYIIEQFRKNFITRDLALRRLSQAGVKNPESLLDKDVLWELEQ